MANNLFDCGITVVGHNPKAAPGGKPAPKTAGVYANLITGNNISGNGIKGGGAGVVLATGLPGGAVYDNTVSGNAINGNGMSGVTVHSHVPGQFLNGNVIAGNQIGMNNLNGDSDFAPHVDKQTTGVLVATVKPLAITVYMPGLSQVAARQPGRGRASRRASHVRADRLAGGERGAHQRLRGVDGRTGGDHGFVRLFQVLEADAVKGHPGVVNGQLELAGRLGQVDGGAAIARNAHQDLRPSGRGLGALGC